MFYLDLFKSQPVNGQKFKLKPFEEYDVDVKIEACGVCGSDVHAITGGWGAQHFPLAVGHGKQLPASSTIRDLTLFTRNHRHGSSGRPQSNPDQGGSAGWCRCPSLLLR
jgi:hypothetical protein